MERRVGKPADSPYGEYFLYVVTHKKMRRKMACLVPAQPGLKRKTISYARYLMAVHLGRRLKKSETVDHVNHDKTDDRIENLQLLSREANFRKFVAQKAPVVMVTFQCGVCGNDFLMAKRNVPFRPNPTCSKPCAGKRMHMKNYERSPSPV